MADATIVPFSCPALSLPSSFVVSNFLYTSRLSLALSMAEQRLQVEKVAVIGAGVSGVAAGIHLKRTGLDVTIYERNARAGGIW